MAIKIIRLKTGEDIIGTVKTTMEREYIVDKPILLYLHTPTQVGFIPYLPFANLDKGLHINISDTMWCIDPEDELAAKYTQTTTNLVVPPSVGSNQLKLSR